MRVNSKALIVRFLLIIAISLSAGLWPTSGQTEERLLENAIPQGVPIKFQLKKECDARFKDLSNHKWVEDFELEVTNTGDKPIYYLALTLVTNVDGSGLVLPDVQLRKGNNFVMDVRFGRDELGDIVSKSTLDDPPLKPGETCLLRIHPGEVTGWEYGLRDGQPDATKIAVILQILSFGDGTGHFGNSAKIYPSKLQD
jgi:hypothetical protein